MISAIVETFRDGGMEEILFVMDFAACVASKRVDGIVTFALCGLHISVRASSTKVTTPPLIAPLRVSDMGYIRQHVYSAISSSRT